MQTNSSCRILCIRRRSSKETVHMVQGVWDIHKNIYIHKLFFLLFDLNLNTQFSFTARQDPTAFIIKSSVKPLKRS